MGNLKLKNEKLANQIKEKIDFKDIEDLNNYFNYLVASRKDIIKRKTKNHLEACEGYYDITILLQILFGCLSFAALVTFLLPLGMLATFIGSLGIGSIIFTAKVIKKIIITKKLDAYIKELESLILETSESKFSNSSEKENNINSNSKYKIDEFINLINKNIKKLSELKYPGVEDEIKSLYTLAMEYLDRKRKMQTMSETEVLASNNLELLKRLNEIEDIIRKKETFYFHNAQNTESILKAIEEFNLSITQEKQEESVLLTLKR